MTHDFRPTLHLVCGKIASGKSTLTRKLGAEPRTVVLHEDDWLAALYGQNMETLADFVRCSGRLRDAMQSHILDLLQQGLSVVLDFQANTLDSRAWMRSLIDTSGAAHVLHYLDVPDEVCKARLRARNQAGVHAFSVSDEQFDLISSYFVPPATDEGFNIRLYRPDTDERF